MAKKDRDDLTAELKESAHKIWLAGLGAWSLAKSQGTRGFNRLVERGQELEERAKPAFSRLKGRAAKVSAEVRGRAEETWDTIEGSIESRLSGVLQKLGVPDRDVIGALTKRVDALTRRIEAMGSSASKSSRKKTTSKKAAKKKVVRKAAAKKMAKKRARSTSKKAPSRRAKKSTR
ncbi:MAG: phasin family protein [Acidobacteriota bacterium]|nr:MAG: phasin family protein [Acidobacteriota bacterium]